MKLGYVFAGCALVLAGMASAAQAIDDDEILARMIAGESVLQGKELDAALKKAEAYPLGSRDNPVRASHPQGQRAYLNRLRCSGGDRPSYERAGNLGPGVYENIVDLYVLGCKDGSKAEVVMDMYHDGYVENRPVPGFTIVK